MSPEPGAASGPGIGRRLAALRSPPPGVRRWLLVVAVALFLGATLAAAVNLPSLPEGNAPRWWLFAVTGALSLVAVATNAAEFSVSGSLLGERIGARDALQVSVLSTAANLLPIPGAAIVKTEALRRRGQPLRHAATVTVAIGAVWVGVAAILCGALVVGRAGDDGIGWFVLAVGTGVVVVSTVVLATQPLAVPWTTAAVRVIAVETASVALLAVRMWFVLRAMGYDGSLAQGAVLATTAVVASAAGLFPGGLGLREALSAATGPAIGIAAPVATTAAAVERVISLAVVGLTAALVLLAVRRSPAPAGAEPEGGGAGETTE